MSNQNLKVHYVRIRTPCPNSVIKDDHIRPWCPNSVSTVFRGAFIWSYQLNHFDAPNIRPIKCGSMALFTTIEPITTKSSIQTIPLFLNSQKRSSWKKNTLCIVYLLVSYNKHQGGRYRKFHKVRTTYF